MLLLILGRTEIAKLLPLPGCGLDTRYLPFDSWQARETLFCCTASISTLLLNVYLEALFIFEKSNQIMKLATRLCLLLRLRQLL